MKLTVGQLKKLVLREATGDGKFELIDASNFEHLEVGNEYIAKVEGERIRTVFVDWVLKDGSSADPDERNPEKVELRFRDVKDGFEWEAFYFKGHYAQGSGAEPLYVKEV